MKRSYQGRASGLTSSSDGERSFWPSYADMMSAVALILFFIMLLAYIQNIITGNELTNTRDMLENTKTELEDTSAILSITLGKVDEAEEELSKVSLDLAAANSTLSEQQAEIDARDAALAEQNTQLAEQNSLLANQNAQLAAQDEQLSSQAAQLANQTDELERQQQLINDQAVYLAAANEELLEMRGQMQTIALFRITILEQMRDAIVNVMGSSATVSIGENGNLIISENILFDSGSYEIKPEAEPVLTRLEYVFNAFLSESDNAKYVDSIVISGHTDSVGFDEDNRILSTDRANAVLNYIMAANNGELSQYAQFFCAAGYGETRPVASNDSAAGRAANRRIEISITLKDDSILEIVESYLNLEVPGT